MNNNNIQLKTALENMFRLVCFLLTYVLIALPAQASFSPKYYALECGQSFGCPQALQRRIHFWIDIFGRHNTNSAVFHDRDEPQKVYSVLERPGACGGRSTPKTIEKERQRIKKILLSIAEKNKTGKNLTTSEQQLATYFKNQPSSTIIKASKRIRCQSGNSTRFRKAVKRFGSHRHAVSSALKEFGLPEGIQYLPFVESAYSPSNYSRVGAAGLWQLMPATANHLGLLVNPVIDERMDPEISTLGAIKYLQHSYEVLAPAARAINPNVTEAEIYPFVMTSYNFGLSGMLRAMNELGLDFVDVLNNYKSKSFQVAVKNFYASFLAARHVATHTDEFFSTLPENKPVNTAYATNNKARSVSAIARHFKLTVEQLKTHNPALTPAVWKGQHLIPKGYVLRLPQSDNGHLNNRITTLNQLPANKPPRKLQHYRVRRGDTACGIAHRYKVSCKQLVRINRLGRKAVVRIGKNLLIPGGSVILKKPVTAARTRIFGNKVFSAKAIMAAPIKTITEPAKKYTVSKGDTTCMIAEQFKLSCQALRQYNHINKAGKIYIGQTLTIPGKTRRVVSKLTNIGLIETQTNASESSSFIVPTSDSLEIIEQIHYTSYLDRFISTINPDNPLEYTAKYSTLAIHETKHENTNVISNVLPSSEIKPTIQQRSIESNKGFDDLNKQKVEKQKTAISAAGKHNNKPQKIARSIQRKQALNKKTIGQSFGSGEELLVSQKGKGWTIRVATDETLGHYADWLGIGFSKPILKLNGIKSSRSVWVGKTIRLPIKNKSTRIHFEEKRIAYHRNLQKQYFDHYAVTGKKQYRFQSGDNPWTIASAHQIPLWLLKRFNPDIFDNQHAIGNVLVLPVLTAQQS